MQRDPLGQDFGETPDGSVIAPGRAALLDARTGAVGVGSGVGFAPVAAAVDEHSGLAFVVNQYASCPIGLQPPGSVSILRLGPPLK